MMLFRCSCNIDCQLWAREKIPTYMAISKEDLHYKSSHIVSKILLIKHVAQFLPLLTCTLLAHIVMYSLLCLQTDNVLIVGL
jgi:hypothetical protein